MNGRTNAEKLQEIQNEAGAIFDLMQQLNVPATENNIVILNACMASLKMIGQICGQICETEKGAEADAGKADAE